MTYVDKVAWIYIKDKKILSTLSKGKDTYYIPGGKRDAEESDEECLIREIKEELSVDLKPETITFVGEFEAIAHGKDINIKMRCYYADFGGTLEAANEIQEIVWLTYEDKIKSSPVDNVVFEWLKDKKFID